MEDRTSHENLSIKSWLYPWNQVPKGLAAATEVWRRCRIEQKGLRRVGEHRLPPSPLKPSPSNAAIAEWRVAATPLQCRPARWANERGNLDAPTLEVAQKLATRGALL